MWLRKLSLLGLAGETDLSRVWMVSVFGGIDGRIMKWWCSAGDQRLHSTSPQVARQSLPTENLLCVRHVYEARESASHQNAQF
jgi:hypothetical protein